MKKCYLDSNVLIYFKDDKSPQHKEALDKLIKLISLQSELYISPLVLDEFIYVIKHLLSLQKSKTVFTDLEKSLRDILDIPNIKLINPPIEPVKQLETVKYMRKYRLSARDAYHLLIILENKINFFFTFDNDFKSVFTDRIITSY